jgi:hypothetical protein
MSELRVEAITDFSGVEYVFCSDKEIRREHFPEEEWVTVQICVSLQTLLVSWRRQTG